MSHCRFDFAFTIPRASLVESIRSHVHGAGGSFEGTADGGDFFLPTPVGEFRGRYLVSASTSTLTIEVDEKPFFVPCSAIETRLSEYVEKAR